MAKKIYKDFGITLLVFYIVIFVFLLFICGVFVKLMETDKSDDFLSTFIRTNFSLISFNTLFYNTNMFGLFVAITLLNLIFGLVHGIYIFSQKKVDFYTVKNEKDILKPTFAGYMLIIIAYLLLIFLPLCFPNIFIFDEKNTKYKLIGITLLFGLLVVIGTILLGVGLSNIKEKDKKMKDLRSASIVAPTFIGITGVIYGIVHASCILIDKDLINSENKKQEDINPNQIITILQNQREQMKNINPIGPSNSLFNKIKNVFKRK
jgi:hypothetical protein